MLPIATSPRIERRSFGTAAFAAVVAVSMASMVGITAMADQDDMVRFESGGAGLEDLAAMNGRAAEYSLKLILAAKGSGAYLADVGVTIASLPQRKTVLEHRTEGPVLLAALPPGRYEIRATYENVLPGAAKTVRRTVVVPRQGLRQEVLYFATAER